MWGRVKTSSYFGLCLPSKYFKEKWCLKNRKTKREGGGSSSCNFPSTETVEFKCDWSTNVPHMMAWRVCAVIHSSCLPISSVSVNQLCDWWMTSSTCQDNKHPGVGLRWEPVDHQAASVAERMRWFHLSVGSHFAYCLKMSQAGCDLSCSLTPTAGLIVSITSIYTLSVRESIN